MVAFETRSVMLHRPLPAAATAAVVAPMHVTQAVPVTVNVAPNVATANIEVAHMVDPGMVFRVRPLGQPRDAFNLPTLIAPGNPPTDQMLLEALRDPTKRFFAPRYVTASAPGAGPPQQWVTLETTAKGGLRSLMGQGGRLFPGADALGCLCSLRAWLALDGGNFRRDDVQRSAAGPAGVKLEGPAEQAMSFPALQPTERSRRRERHHVRSAVDFVHSGHPLPLGGEVIGEGAGICVERDRVRSRADPADAEAERVCLVQRARLEGKFAAAKGRESAVNERLPRTRCSLPQIYFGPITVKRGLDRVKIPRKFERKRETVVEPAEPMIRLDLRHVCRRNADADKAWDTPRMGFQTKCGRQTGWLMGGTKRDTRPIAFGGRADDDIEWQSARTERRLHIQVQTRQRSVVGLA